MRIRDEQGGSLVEFALGSSVLLMTLFGIFAICLALYSYVFVAEAAREATRYALVRGSSCTGFSDCGITSAELNTYVKNLGYPGINTSKLSATATWLSPSANVPTTWSACTPCNAPGDAVEVQVTYTFPLGIPFWPKSGSLIHMSSSSQMTISQ